MDRENNAGQIAASEDILDVIAGFNEVVEKLQTAGNKIGTLKRVFRSGDFYMGNAEKIINNYYVLMEKNVEQLIRLYEGSEKYSLNAVCSLMFMDRILAGQYGMTSSENTSQGGDK